MSQHLPTLTGVTMGAENSRPTAGGKKGAWRPAKSVAKGVLKKEAAKQKTSTAAQPSTDAKGGTGPTVSTTNASASTTAAAITAAPRPSLNAGTPPVVRIPSNPIGMTGKAVEVTPRRIKNVVDPAEWREHPFEKPLDIIQTEQ